MNSQVPHLTPLTPPASAAQDPLAALQDIHVPADIGIWPLAWGWWVLITSVLVALGLALFFIQRKRARNRYRNIAIAELNHIQASYSQEQNSEYLQALSVLLRRTALSGFGSHFNASLKGQAWLEWLDEQCPKTRQQFSRGAGNALLTGPYQKNVDFDRTALHQLCLLWISEHRNQWQKPKVVKREAISHA